MTGKKEIRLGLFDEAIKLTTQDRAATYGDFFDNMKLQGDVMNLLYDAGLQRYSAAHNKAIEYAIGKICRMAMGVLHRDNYVDIINYVTAAYEAEIVVTDPQKAAALHYEYNRQRTTHVIMSEEVLEQVKNSYSPTLGIRIPAPPCHVHIPVDGEDLQAAEDAMNRANFGPEKKKCYLNPNLPGVVTPHKDDIIVSEPTLKVKNAIEGEVTSDESKTERP